MSRFVRNVVLYGFATAAFVACGGGGGDSITSPGGGSASVSSVSVSPGTGSVQAGATLTLAATIRDAAGNTLSGRSVTWQTSNTSVAIVSSSGLVTGVGPGTDTVTATSEGKSGVTIITVTPAPVATVAVIPPTASLVAGATTILSATTSDAAGIVLTGRLVTWQTSNAGIATVSASGVVTGIAPGSATITATSEGKLGTSAITVTPVPVAHVSVTPAATSIIYGSTTTLAATATDASGNTLTGRVIKWSSGDPTIATVDSITGVVTSAGAGTAIITATSEGKSGTASVTVTRPAVGRISTDPAGVTVKIGASASLAYTLYDSQGNQLPLYDSQGNGIPERRMTAVNQSAIITVAPGAAPSQTYVITGNAAGSASFTVSSGSVTITVNVTVTP